MIFSFSFFFFGLDVPWNFLLTSSLLLLVFVCSMLLLAIKLHQHLSFQCSHLKSLCNIATSRVFTMNPCQHFPCTEAVLALFFSIKLPQHFICIEATSTLHSYRSHEATSTIHFCHEAMTTLHISTEVMPILVFATKPRQHFIRTEAMPTFIFVMKPRQHSTLALALALKLHQYLHWATSKLHLHQSCANIHEATESWQHSTLAQIFKGNIA